MLYQVGHSFCGIQLFLAHPAEDLQRHDLDRYVLLKRLNNESSENREMIFHPHDTIQFYGREMLAGDVVLSWLNKRGDYEAETFAARSFFGWNTTELSANQKLFVAEVEERGYTVDYDYVPENSYGQICPAIYIGSQPFWVRRPFIDGDEPNYGTDMNAVCEVDWELECLFARY